MSDTSEIFPNETVTPAVAPHDLGLLTNDPPPAKEGCDATVKALTCEIAHEFEDFLDSPEVINSSKASVLSFQSLDVSNITKDFKEVINLINSRIQKATSNGEFSIQIKRGELYQERFLSNIELLMIKKYLLSLDYEVTIWKPHHRDKNTYIVIDWINLYL